MENFPDNSRIWLYTTDRALSNDEQAQLQKEIDYFVSKWAAHGNKLWATGKVVNPYFVCFIVNENLTPPSGCSIDASVNFLKAQAKQLDVDFFNRLNVVFLMNDDYKLVPMHEINSTDFSGDELVFDPLITQLSQLNSNWPTPLKISSLSYLL